MLITIACPFCERRFQVDASLRGRQMRCPMQDCREVFEVREAAPAPEPPIEGVPLPSPPPSQKSGRVEEMVPVLGAEVATPPAADEPQAPPSWQQGPPPVRKPGAAGESAAPPAPPPAPAPAPDWRQTPPPRSATPAPSRAEETPPPKRKDRAEKAAPDSDGANGAKPRPSRGPVVHGPGSWEPPPVRRGDGAVTASVPGRRTTLEMEAAARTTQAKKRRHTWLILGIAAGIVVTLLGMSGAAWYVLRDSEDKDRGIAEKFYADKQYDQANAQYAKVIKKYPESARLDEYQFLQELNAILALPTHLDRRGAFDQVSKFLKDRKDDARLADHSKEVGEALLQLLDDAGKAAKENVHDDEIQAHFKRGQEVLADFRAPFPESVPADILKKVEQEREEVAQKLQQELDRQNVIKQMQALAEKPTAVEIRKARELLAQEAAKPTHFDQDAEVKKAENALYEKHLASVTFTEDDVPLGPDARVAEDRVPGLLVQPVLAPAGEGPPLKPDRVFFALARGVLYALSQDQGEIQWAMRVGIDTAELPLRVPPLGATPELALVLSADSLTLTAVSVRSNGETLWRRRLGAASLGRPVIVDRRVYVPTLNGEVQEIEVDGGGLLGRYKLGQSLSVGGARFGDTKQVFFPGDDSCVYVLDVAKRECQAILYTEHAAGSLRGEPILLPSKEDPKVPGYLVLCQSHGLDATILRTFRLLPPEVNAEPGSKEKRLRIDATTIPERRLRGWPWFPPYRDPEKLVTVTDAGVLGLYGVVQAHNNDDALFPLVRVPGAEEGTVELSGKGAARSRAQVAYAQENGLWVLARGLLLRYELTFDKEAGPQAVPDPTWGAPLELGSPLHDSQTDDNGTTLFLVTQSPNGHACLATAVDARSGRVRWQRQLGLVCHGDPQRLGSGVVTLDQGGGLFLFDPARHPQDGESQWQSGGFKLADPLPEESSASIYLVPGPDGQTLYEFACPDPGKRLIVRVYQVGRESAPPYVFDNLPARLVGTPAVGLSRILLPLADGGTRQVRLPLNADDSRDGPRWRAGRTEARGHVAWLGGDDFLTTNGERGLTRWHFRAGDIFEGVPADREAQKPTLELSERVAGAPAVLSRSGDGTTLRVCVADEKGTVHLFEGEDLKPARQWALKGSITAGPFVRGSMAGCVVDGRKLVWLDPAKDAPLWTYESPGEGIVGRPQVADGLVLVADVSGRFVGLDPATGRPSGPGYTLRASVAPAASPVGFGPGRAFAPLTDGTVLLLPLERLRWPLVVLPAW